MSSIEEVREYEEEINARLYELGVADDPKLSSLCNYIFHAIIKRLEECEKST